MYFMFCQKCGKEIPDDSTFCPVCGANTTGANGGSPVAAPKINLQKSDYMMIIAVIFAVFPVIVSLSVFSLLLEAAAIIICIKVLFKDRKRTLLSIVLAIVAVLFAIIGCARGINSLAYILYGCKLGIHSGIFDFANFSVYFSNSFHLDSMFPNVSWLNYLLFSK